MAKKWLINETVTQGNFITNITFVSNNETFSSFEVFSGEKWVRDGRIKYDGDIKYWEGGGWGAGYNDVYRTVEFETEPTDELLTWLEANATPIGASTKKYLKFNNKIVKTINSKTVGSFNGIDIVKPREGGSGGYYTLTITASGDWDEPQIGGIVITKMDQTEVFRHRPADKSSFPQTVTLEPGEYIITIIGTGIRGNGLTSSDFIVGSQTYKWQPSYIIDKNGVIDINVRTFYD